MKKERKKQMNKIKNSYIRTSLPKTFSKNLKKFHDRNLDVRANCPRRRETVDVVES